MVKKLLGLLLVTFTVLFFVPSVIASQGCCSWHGGESYCSLGRWVCADGTYSPTCTCGYYIPPPVYYPVYIPPPAPRAPAMNASFTYEPNANYTYNVLMKWNHVSNTGFSLALHNLAGGDPGPLTDTTNDYFTFYNVSPGVYYVDMKVGINGIWSTITYWKIVVPNWIAPTPIITETATPTIVTQTNNKSVIASFFDWLLSIGSSNTPNPIPSSSTKQAPYTCNCAKTCTQISTCEEAYYQLNTCGCSARDGDHDGVPCENLCR